MQRTGAAKGCGAKIARSEAKCKTRKSDMSVRAHKALLVIRITSEEILFLLSCHCFPLILFVKQELIMNDLMMGM